jgi:hypothetical protein
MQDNWVQLLPMAEFAYNNSVHSAIKCTPFMANYGFNPRADDLSRATSLTDDPEELSTLMKQVDSFLQGNLEIARADMKRHADRTRADSVKYKPGDQVLLSLEHITTRQPKVKWSDKRTGPYKIVKEAHEGSDSYVLELPSSWNVYPVFHTSLLTPFKEYTEDPRSQPPPPPIVVDDNEEYEIERIVDRRVRYKKVQYLVKWAGYDLDEKNDWIHEDGLVHAQELVNDFMATYKPPSRRQLKRKKKRK